MTSPVTNQRVSVVFIASGVVLVLLGVALLTVLDPGPPAPPPPPGHDLTFRPVLELYLPDEEAPPVTSDPGKAIDEAVVLPAHDDPRGDVHYALGPAALTGEDFTETEIVQNPLNQQWYVNLVMTEEGQQAWERFTAEQACLRDEQGEEAGMIAVTFEEEVISASGLRPPGKRGAVRCGRGITTGQTQVFGGTRGRAAAIEQAIAREQVIPEDPPPSPFAVPVLGLGGMFILIGIVRRR